MKRSSSYSYDIVELHIRSRVLILDVRILLIIITDYYFSFVYVQEDGRSFPMQFGTQVKLLNIYWYRNFCISNS